VAAWNSRHRGTSLYEERRGKHVEEFGKELFLWHPREFERELLYSVPLKYGSDRVLGADLLARFREAQRRADQIQLIRDVAAHTQDDSVRVIFTTYVPRPGTEPRSYLIRTTLSVPDTDAWKKRMSASSEYRLPDRMLVLGPRAQEVEYVIDCRTLRNALMPRLRMIGMDREPTHYTGIWITLVPGDVSPDDARALPGIYDGSVSLSVANIEVPLH
jgi:hypothetical protein